MFLPECPFYVGIDWAAETHAVCMLDGSGKVISEFTLAHTAAGFTELLAGLPATTPRCRSGSNAPTGAWSTRCCRPGTRSCR